MKRGKIAKLKLEVPRIRSYRRIILTRSKGPAVGRSPAVKHKFLTYIKHKHIKQRKQKNPLMHMPQAQVYVRKEEAKCIKKTPPQC